MRVEGLWQLSTLGDPLFPSPSNALRFNFEVQFSGVTNPQNATEILNLWI